jgi:hypothetical protein
MIDRVARKTLAQALRALASGQITNDTFERRLPLDSIDPAVHEVFQSGAWYLYGDLDEYRLTGPDKLTRAAKSEIARWILFLETDLPYEWPQLRGWKYLGWMLGNLITIGVLGRIYRRHLRRIGDPDVWPFFRGADLDIARRSPVYMARVKQVAGAQL